jgi:hypothetical protein
MPHYYFRTPNFDINPDSLIAPRLGSIFSNLRRLTGPLNQHDRLSIPSDLTNDNETHDFTDARAKNVQGHVGLHGELAQSLAGSGELIYGFAKDTTITYFCSRLDTEEFAVDKDYIVQSIHASQRVQHYIQDSFMGNKTVYMITGLKVATNFRMTKTESSTHGPTLKVGADATALGFPASGGPQGDLQMDTSTELSSGPSPKVVFAYRAIKIRPKSDGDVKFKDISGGQYSLDNDHEDEDDWTAEDMDENDRATIFPESVSLEVVQEDEV